MRRHFRLVSVRLLKIPRAARWWENDYSSTKARIVLRTSSYALETLRHFGFPVFKASSRHKFIAASSPSSNVSSGSTDRSEILLLSEPTSTIAKSRWHTEHPIIKTPRLFEYRTQGGVSEWQGAWRYKSSQSTWLQSGLLHGISFKSSFFNGNIIRVNIV
jgi:hypothetical protein